MIKNIVFDVGRVLVEYDPDKYMKGLGFDDAAMKAVNEAMFLHPLWNESDRGVLSTAELLEGFVKNNPAYEAEIRRAYGSVEGTIQPLDYAVPWVKELKERGYRLYILSNYAEDTFQRTKCKMGFLPYMDGVVFSYQCKLVKPEPEIYRYLCDTYQLIPSESVFLDDRADNIEAAKEAGLYGIQFFGYEQGSRELEELLKNT
ncbi:MAG: HAD family phosphatase [Clostridiales bacterium]|nr:HAD family phosphatase [Clostridiales bacterium]